MGRWAQSRRRAGATVAASGFSVPAPTGDQWLLATGGEADGYNATAPNGTAAPDGVNGFHVRYRFFGGPDWLTIPPADLDSDPDFGSSDWPNIVEAQIAWTTDGADVSDYSESKFQAGV